MKPSGIGGMAVMEGVMMKNKDEYAVAVRKPDKEIVVEKSMHKDLSEKVKLFKLPILRGINAFVDSMVVGVKVLNYSASFFEDEDEPQTDKDKEKSEKKQKKVQAKKAKIDVDFEIEEVSAVYHAADVVQLTEAESQKLAEEKAKKDEKSNAILMIFTVLLSIVISVTVFMVLPTYIIELLKRFSLNKYLLSFIEGILRLAIFIGYVSLTSLMPEIKRVFMYHGAEHKTINCLENGFELTVENVRWQSKRHKRCGTSFIFLVFLISLFLFMVFPTTSLFWRIVSRVLLVPFIAGISYEFIRLAGKSENKLVDFISKPGLWMQGLTTKEPDDSMIEVAIQSVNAVFDSKVFLEAYKAEKTDTKKTDTKKIEKTNTKNIEEKHINSAKLTTAEVKAKETPKEKAKDKETLAKGESAAAVNKPSGVYEAGKRNPGTAPINFKPVVPNRPEDEDDEILKALDKFFDKSQGKAGENK